MPTIHFTSLIKIGMIKHSALIMPTIHFQSARFRMHSKHGASFRIAPYLLFSLALPDYWILHRRMHDFGLWQARLKKSVAIKA